MSLLSRFAQITEPRRVWHKWPFALGLAIVLGHRENLRRNNLADTETGPPKVDPPNGADIIGARTADGSFNDLGQPWMGRAGARFGRNVPLASTFGETKPELFDPSPRLVSNRLLARRDFVPVPHLNVLAAAWIQFMVHDWLSHGKNDAEVLYDIPLPDGDDWNGSMTVPRTMPDNGTSDVDKDRPPTFRNVETHWWDASQIYGSSAERIAAVRSGGSGKASEDGKIPTRDDLLPIDHAASEKDIELAGVNGNWWIGLSVLHTLFVREHNAVVDRLRVDFPAATGEWLFQKARLVVSALTAKIHTVEWTPALMDSPSGRMAMRGNYWGLVGERGRRALGRLSDSEVISGIPGSPADHHRAPFAMTEEFAAVYRLHSLMPDGFSFRSHETDETLHETTLLKGSGRNVPGIYKKAHGFDNVLYSLATSNPGALVLHNFPNDLRRLPKENGKHFIDLAAIDILRDRERGVPRFKEFRRLTGMKEPRTFADITSNREWQKELQEVYGTVEKVDLLVGTLAESQSENGQPPRFGFSDTAFRIFILMASRRLKSDRFFTDDFRPEIYTPAGFDWVTQNTMRSVVERHAPALADHFGDVRNMFFPWTRAER